MWADAYRALWSWSGCPGVGAVILRRPVGWSVLPALTPAACRITMSVTAAVSVESHSHLFVFHLVVHLCISMVRARSCTEKRATINTVRSLPQSTRERRVHYNAMCGSVRMPRTTRPGPSDALPFKPSSHNDGKGLSLKECRQLCSLRVAHRQEAGQTPSHWTWTVCKILTLENPLFIKSPAGKLFSGPAPELWERSEKQHPQSAT